MFLTVHLDTGKETVVAVAGVRGDLSTRDTIVEKIRAVVGESAGFDMTFDKAEQLAEDMGLPVVLFDGISADGSELSSVFL